MLLKKLKTYFVTFGVIGLILGSVFALCYTPFMEMTSAHSAAAQTTHMDTGTQQCCENKTSPHMLTAAALTVNVVGLKNILALLALGSLFLLISFQSKSKNETGLKFLFARRFILRLHDYLVLFFSRGLLHPKLYNA